MTARATWTAWMACLARLAQLAGRPNRWIIVALRVGLGVLFVAAAWPKIRDPAAFSQAVAHYHLLGETAGRLMALVLPPLEMLVGIALILGVVRGGAALLALAMMVAFTAAIGVALARGLDISCGCFDTEGGQRVGLGKMAENIALIAACVVVWMAALRGRPKPRDAAVAGTGRVERDRIDA